MSWGAERTTTRGKKGEMAGARGPTLLGSGAGSKVQAQDDPEIVEFERDIERKKKHALASALLTEVVERVPSLTFADGAIIALVDQEGGSFAGPVRAPALSLAHGSSLTLD